MILNVFLSFWHKMPRSTERAFQQNQTTLDAGSMCTMKGAPERSRGGHPSWLPIVTRTKVSVCETRCFPKSPLVLPWMWCLEDLENCCEYPCSSFVSCLMNGFYACCLKTVTCAARYCSMTWRQVATYSAWSGPPSNIWPSARTFANRRRLRRRKNWRRREANNCLKICSASRSWTRSTFKLFKASQR